MSSTRKLSSRLTQLLELFNRNDDWLIVINADPDAMASAMALKRIMSHRTGKVTIARINELGRKAKTPEGLTPEELTERDKLRRVYIDAMKASLIGQLENTYIVDEKGNKRKLRNLADEARDDAKKNGKR